MIPADQELFGVESGNQPLAARMRPRTLDEFIGQQHILAPGRLLRRAIQADMLSSIILSGPPGSGKTTLAEVIANTTRGRFRSLNAVLSGVKEVREAIAEAENAMRHQGRRTILFVDEVHRWNKAQQDALLPWVENGTVILVGATTENPYFEVNSALVSRSRIFLLKKLTEDEIREVAHRALSDRDRGYGRYRVLLEPEALDHLVRVSDGDARVLLNALQLAVETTPERFPPSPEEEVRVTLSVAEDSIQKKALLYDREGDYHFDSISAFIKSLRGSDPDAALYWMARMIAAGEDPRYILRRMLILAAEDIGMADPQALVVATAAAAAFDRVGMPEGQFHLAQAALYLATANKSNTTLSYFDALSSVETDREQEVPRHLRDANRDGPGMGHGAGYLYPHAYSDHWTPQRYLPASLAGTVFYEPSSQGYEGSIREEVLRRRELVVAASFEDQSEDVYSVAPQSGPRESWYRRLTSRRAERLEAIRGRLIDLSGLSPHHRVLIVGQTPTLMLWEVHRIAHAGSVVLLPPAASREANRELGTIRESVELLPEVERPILLPVSEEPLRQSVRQYDDSLTFDRILGRNYLGSTPDPGAALEELKQLLAPEGRVVLAESVPRESTRLSELLKQHCDPEPALVDAVAAAEHEAVRATEAAGALSPEAISALTEGSGTQPKKIKVTYEGHLERRVLDRHLVSQWFAPGGSGPLSSALAGIVGSEEHKSLSDLAHSCLAGREVEWRFTVAYLTSQ